MRGRRRAAHARRRRRVRGQHGAHRRPAPRADGDGAGPAVLGGRGRRGSRSHRPRVPQPRLRERGGAIRGAMLAENDTRADVRFAISEGPQVIVDHVIIVGNDRTSTRDDRARAAAAAGRAARLLGAHREPAAARRARAVPPRRASRSCGTPASRGATCSCRSRKRRRRPSAYGGGVEGGTRLRPTGEGGQAEERFELAPRGFFEIGRRNLWGKNRSVNLFTRVSLRSRDVVLSDSGIRFAEPTAESGYGFNEYRVRRHVPRAAHLRHARPTCS